MEKLTHLIAKLWTLLNARAETLRVAWKNFDALPQTLPRHMHAAVTRELQKLERLLRRKILFDAVLLQSASLPTPPTPPKPHTVRNATRTATKPDITRPASFRFDETPAREQNTFVLPRFLQIKGLTPAIVRPPPAEMLNTAALVRRARAFYTALEKTDALAHKLARRLSRNRRLRFRPFQPRPHEYTWRTVFSRTDWMFASFCRVSIALDSS